MALRSLRTAALLGGVLLTAVLGAPRPASAGEAAQLHGVVLSVLPDKGEAIVRHDPFGGMPGMTMLFRVAPAAKLRALRPGDQLDATVDRSSDPWTLRDVKSRQGVALTGGAATAATGAGSAASTSVFRTVRRLDAGDPVPATRFIDQRGQPFTLADFRGRIVVLSFIYTRCRDARMCPLISANFHTLQARLGAGPYHLVEITLDPEYDRPRVLAAYGRAFGADPTRWTLGTGAPDAVLDFAAQFGITAFPDPSVGLIHAERTALIDQSGRIRQLIDEAGWSPGGVIAQLRAMEHLPANPIARFDLWLSQAAVAICGNSVAGFSGLLDLAVVVLVVGAFGWLFFRVARKIFAAS
jgi:protein SCO1/2